MLLGVAALVLLPAAIAFACVPASSIGFDKTGYKYNAGDTVTVTGRGFQKDTAVTLKLQEPSGTQSTVGTAGKNTDGTGNFSDSFPLASDARSGDYVVQVTVGTGGARETFTVEPKPAAAQPSPNPAVIPQFVAPPSPQSNTGATRAARARAIRNCRAQFRSSLRKARSSRAWRSSATRETAMRKMAKRRSACIRRAKRRYP